MRTLTPGNAIIALTFASYVLQPLYPECEPPLGAVRLLAASLVCKPGPGRLEAMLTVQYSTVQYSWQPASCVSRGRGGWRPC